MLHFPYGTPTWIDLGSHDIGASVAFYTNLFGWEANTVEQSGGYRMFSCEGKIVAGIHQLQDRSLSPQWMTYISTDNATRTTNRIEAAGGQVLMERDIADEMSMMVFRDTVGAVCGVFQGRLFNGAHVFNQPVSLTFNLLMTRQPHAAKSFYAHIFGWEPGDRKIGEMAFTYFFQEVRGVAGLMAMNERWPQAVPSHWQISFSVDDADKLAARAVELGGKAQPVFTTPFGRSALLTDPQGASFSISQQTPEVRAAVQTPEGVLAELRK
ncbi:putative glyoxylase CFP32 [Reticulibacter mediterranei]|uniref:Putative glyoxylase CFP32 n=1 Tax=Reticulibacter mediterranei TaxID=2778369 RepID=A0A8J3N3Q1_9CHLR|nr:VOC family protein [Reticulibacter mediterranei]GHO93377.1 putative glyoxylase CFP32 [Reticulibacter mediterranei]